LTGAFFVRSLPDAISPSLVTELKVTGIIANEPIPHVSNVSGLLSKVRIDPDLFLFKYFESHIL
jgi:hypothetical protein